MRGLTTFVAALALCGTAAFAQTPPAGPRSDLPIPPSSPPPVGAPGSIPEIAPGSDLEGVQRERQERRARRDVRDRGERRGAGPSTHRRMHHGMGYGMAGRGAFFMFERPGGGRIVAKCADEDSTRECVEVIRPMLQGMMGPGGPRPGPGGGPGAGRPGMGGLGPGPNQPQQNR